MRVCVVIPFVLDVRLVDVVVVVDSHIQRIVLATVTEETTATQKVGHRRRIFNIAGQLPGGLIICGIRPRNITNYNTPGSDG